MTILSFLNNATARGRAMLLAVLVTRSLRRSLYRSADARLSKMTHEFVILPAFAGRRRASFPWVIGQIVGVPWTVAPDAR